MVIESVVQNIPALRIVNELRGTQNRLTTNLERLSTGLRINSPKDNTGGFLIGKRLESEFRSLDRAAENTQEASGFLNTALGAVDSILDSLLEIQTKALAAANSLPGDTALRLSLQEDIQERLDEIDSIARKTRFNGAAFLNGAFSASTGFREGTRNFGATVPFGPDTSTLLGPGVLNIGVTQRGAAEVRSGTDGAFNTGIQLATDIAVSTAQFIEGAAPAAAATNLLGANVTVNGVSLSAGGTIQFSGVLADGNTAFSGVFTIASGAQVSNLVAAVQNVIDSAEASIGVDSTGGTGSLETNVSIDGVSTGRLNFTSGLRGVPSQFDISFNVLNASGTSQTRFGADRSAVIYNERLSTSGTGARIGNGAAAVTGSTFGTGDFAIEVSGVTAAQQRVIETITPFSATASPLFTQVSLGDALQNAFIGSLSLDAGDTIAINGTDPDGTTFANEFTIGGDTGVGDARADTFGDLIDELNNRDRSETGFGFNFATATLTASGTIQLVDDIAAESSTDFTFTVTDVSASDTLTVNSNVNAAGNRESATVSVAGGPAQTVTAGQVVTLYGDESLSAAGAAPRVTLRIGSGLTAGDDILRTTANRFAGSLNGGPVVSFQNGDTGVSFFAGGASVRPSEAGQRVTLDFGAIVDVTAPMEDGGESFILSSASRALNFHIGPGSGERTSFVFADLRPENLGTNADNALADINVTSISGANAALDVIQDALDQVAQVDARIGGFAARLEDRTNFLDIASLNAQNAQTQIVSADVAKETAELAMNTVFLEAQSAVLTQANNSAVSVFKILYGLD